MKSIRIWIDNEDGSIIMLAIMLLALMMIIGISATRMSVAESFTVRNIGIYKQNLHLVESAAMEGLQRIVDMEYDSSISDLDPSRTTQVWIQNDENWKATMDSKWYSKTRSGPVLNTTNSVVPNSVLTGNASYNRILAERGELDDKNLSNTPLRYALVGWEPAPGSTLKSTVPARRSGRLLAEYVSDKYGILRIEAGVERKF